MRRFRVSGFCLRSFARAKNGVNSGRRSHKISVGEAKCNICRHKRAGALHLITACGRSCLAAARVSSSSASGTAGLGSHREPIQYRAPASQPSRGSQSKGRAARGATQTTFAPNTETFSALHSTSVTCLSQLARSPGGLGGRSRIEFIVSPLPRRRHNESHFAAEPPERAFLRRFRVSGFCLRSFARAKNGVNSGRRSHKISVSEAKCNICRHKRAGARLAEQTGFAPNTETFSAVHKISVTYRSRLARSPGFSGGGAALSSLCRRFPGGDIMNLTSRRNPLSVLSWQSRSLHEQRMA